MMARRAGLLWFISGIPAPFFIVRIPRMIMVKDDIAATANNLVAHEGIYRAAIVGGLAYSVMTIFLGFSLYRLFAILNKNRAQQMLAAILIIATLNAANLLNRFGALLTVQTNPEQMMVFLKMSNHGQGIIEIFWAVWFSLMGSMMIRSRLFPRALGYLLIVGGVTYLSNILFYFLSPGEYKPWFTPVTILIAGPCVFANMLWLLIKGVKEEKPAMAVIN